MSREERLLTVLEVAEHLRASPESVRRWIRQGALRGFKPGGTRLGYRISESELRRFLRERGGAGRASDTEAEAET